MGHVWPPLAPSEDGNYPQDGDLFKKKVTIHRMITIPRKVTNHRTVTILKNVLPLVSPFCSIWPQLALFDPFGLVWPGLALFSPVLPRSAPFGPNSPHTTKVAEEGTTLDSKAEE